MNDRQFTAFSKMVHDLTGVTIAAARRSMLISRISSRMRAHQLHDLDAYYSMVENDEMERELFVDKVTTHETYFFRTPRVWEYLEQRFLPAWVKQHGAKPCSIWSAATSSGEEAYSLAMLLDHFSCDAPEFKFSIHATDISAETLGRGKRGIYHGRTIRRLKEARPEFLQRYLQPIEDKFEVSDHIRRFVSFSTHNLFEKQSKPKLYDLVLCRNVLIYFSREDQSRVLTNLRASMRDTGVVVIGESENMPPDNTLFQRVEPLVYGVKPSAPCELQRHILAHATE